MYKFGMPFFTRWGDPIFPSSSPNHTCYIYCFSKVETPMVFNLLHLLEVVGKLKVWRGISTYQCDKLSKKT